ncbi:uncharacterized protein [Phyllobates terribilis]|uniref:uncharacterized protein n=1 Tax=Phyllobates terribilis TaxID=111132 RepID=UPI003CCB184C
MGETGKRSRFQRENDGNNRNQRRRTDRDDNGGDEVIVYRILCPDGIIGSVIGKGGKVINSIRQETRAKIKVVDPFPGAKERVITVYCYVKEKEDVDVDEGYFGDREPLCPAQAALLKLHTAISHSLATLVDSDKKWKDKEECNILVPASQSANIIGKSGAIIKKLRNSTRANIKVTPKDVSDPTHSCALGFDNFVRIIGEPEAVKKALFAVSAIMYKFGPREQIPLDATVPEALPSIIIPSDVPIYSAAGFYDPVAPSRSLNLIPELDGGNSWPPLIGASAVPGYGGTSQEELIIRVLCPSDKIGRVIGKAGMSIRNIRQATGAQIEVVDNKGKGEDSLVTVISSESVDDVKSMAVEAVLLLQDKINDEDAETVTIRLLVSSKVIGCIIGKGGSIINEIRSKSKADVRISKGKSPKYGDSDDEFVEVGGKVVNVRDALVQIVLRLRDDVLKNKDNGYNPSSPVAESVHPSIGASAGSYSIPSTFTMSPLRYEQEREPATRMSRLYGYEPLMMGEGSHGSMPSYSTKLYGRMTPPTTLEIVIPLGTLSKVMGKGGANLANIRQISGAVVEISESVTSRGDRVALVSGTAEQKRSAENLIQAFIMST